MSYYGSRNQFSGQAAPQYPGSDGFGAPQQGYGQPLLQQRQGGGFFPGDRGKTDQYGPPEIGLDQLMQISVLAWIIFSSICLLFGLTYHTSYTEIWTVVILGTVVLVMIIYQSTRQYNESPMNKIGVIVSAWLLAALLSGTFVGLFSYDCCIGEYWDKMKLESRENVLPSEPAGAFFNAGQIIFADEARVDPSKAVGYKDDKVFCVAPIASDGPMDTVQFWAAGINCCGARDSFVCDDAWNPKAHAGVVIRNDTKWSMMHEDIHAQYLKAVKLAEVTYSVASAKKPIFVRWVSNPNQVELNIWRAGMGVLLAAIIIAALLCGLKACAINLLLNGSRSSWSAKSSQAGAQPYGQGYGAQPGAPYGQPGAQYGASRSY